MHCSFSGSPIIMCICNFDGDKTLQKCMYHGVRCRRCARKVSLDMCLTLPHGSAAPQLGFLGTQRHDLET